MNNDLISRVALIKSIQAIQSKGVFFQDGVNAALEKAEDAPAVETQGRVANKTPCDLCMYDPPSSFGGKPCSMCPACAKTGGSEE